LVSLGAEYLRGLVLVGFVTVFFQAARGLATASPSVS